MLKGKRLRLRPLEKKDAPRLARWFNNPEVNQFLRRDFPLMKLEEERWIEELATTRSKTAVILMIEVEVREAKFVPIGDCGLVGIHPVHHRAELGIVIGERRYWSRGYGTEACRLLVNYGFNRLNLHRISSAALEFNKRSIGLLKKLGFKEEGRRRKSDFKNGRFWDMVLFGLLRREWERK